MLLPSLHALLLQVASATSGAAPRDGVAGTAAERIDSFLTRLSGFDYDGSILVVQEGKVTLRKAYGFADRVTASRYTTDAVFDIGSLAKQFTAAAVLELERREKLALDDPLGQFFPDAPADKIDITVEQLLTHTAGFGGDFPDADPSTPDYDDVDAKTAVQRILAQPLEFAPGSSWSY